MPIKQLERAYHILRSVPAKQLARRLQLIAMRKLEPLGLPEPPHLAAEWRTSLPDPVFEPRLEQWRQEGGRAFLDLAWGSLEFTKPMDWMPPLKSRLDGSWRARLHYMEYLEGADDQAFEWLVGDWLDQVSIEQPDMRQFGWRAFNLSIRTVIWMQQVAQRQGRLPQSLKARMAKSLTHQLLYLERFLETDLRGNHLIKNLKALLWAGHCLDGEHGARWSRLGQKWLASELDEQVLPDGMHYERSPAYHCQVLADFVECREVLEPGALRERLDDVIASMSVALGHLVHPDGLVAQFNDGGLRMAYPPAQCLSAANRAAKGNDGLFQLPDAGFFGARWGQDYLIADCGALAPGYLIGHGHGDILSFEWSLAGRRIIVDQGTYQNLGGPRRIKSRATACHNTVSINGLDQGDFYGAHRCGRRPKAEVLSFTPKDAGFVLEGRHDGFSHLRGNPWHMRKFDAAPDRLLIQDTIEGGKEHHLTASFLLHPDCRAESQDGAIHVRSGDEHLRLTSDLPLMVEEAEWYPDLYCALPTSRVVADFGGQDRAEFRLERMG